MDRPGAQRTGCPKGERSESIPPHRHIQERARTKVRAFVSKLIVFTVIFLMIGLFLDLWLLHQTYYRLCKTAPVPYLKRFRKSLHKYLSVVKKHRVPLSDAAVALLEGLPRLKNNNHVFPAPRAETLSDMSLLAVLKRMGYTNLTQHGFRSTFREWAGEATDYQREVIEHALAHQLADKAEAAYQRGTLWPKRVALMDDWTGYSTANS
nr:hypothetical protein [Salmonella enterica]